MARNLTFSTVQGSIFEFQRTFWRPRQDFSLWRTFLAPAPGFLVLAHFLGHRTRSWASRRQQAPYLRIAKVRKTDWIFLSRKANCLSKKPFSLYFSGLLPKSCHTVFFPVSAASRGSKPIPGFPQESAGTLPRALSELRGVTFRPERPFFDLTTLFSSIST